MSFDPGAFVCELEGVVSKLAKIQGDFRLFLGLVWDHLMLPRPTPVQFQIAEYLQHGPDRKIIQGFRGVGKSWITSAYVLWKLFNDPEQKFLVVSASKDRADNFSIFTQRLIREIPVLQDLAPKADQRYSKVAFDVGPAKADHAPSVKSVGIFGQLTGSRASEIIADDVEVRNNSLTQDARDRLIAAVGEFEAIKKPGGKITFLGTPQTEESIYNKLAERGYSARIWPARYPEHAKIEGYRGCLAPILLETLEKNPDMVGKTVEPRRFSDVDLMEREAAFGRSDFALQFQLDTTLADADRYPLKLADLMIMDLDKDTAPPQVQYGSNPELVIKDFPNIGFTGDRWYRPMYVDRNGWVKYEGAVMAIDPSGRGKDDTGYAVVKQLHGKLFLLEAGGFTGGYEQDVLTGLAQVAKRNKVNVVVIEGNFGDGMFAKLFQPVLGAIHRAGIEEVRHNVQKERRIIDTLEPVMNQHKLIIDAGVVRKDMQLYSEDSFKSLFYQMTRLTKDRGSLKHDDRIDVLAMAVAWFVESMAKDELKSFKMLNERLMDEEIESWFVGMDGKGRYGFNADVGSGGKRETWV